MKDVSRRATNQTENLLTPSEDLPFHDDGSLSDSAFQSDFSNGSILDLEKSPSSGDAVSYERNSLQEWTDDLPSPFIDFCSTSCQRGWSEDQSTSYSDSRKRNEECGSKGLVPQRNIERDPTVFEEGDVYWENAFSWSTVGRESSFCNFSDEDALTQPSRYFRGSELSDGVMRKLQGARYLDRNYTHEALSPITEGQGLEEFECYDSDNGIADAESSDESEALWSPSSEDAPLVRPDFVPKLDLSWVFEDENGKQKRSEKRAAARRHAEKVPEINTPFCAKSLKTSTIPDTRKEAENRNMKDKAESPFSECCKEVSHRKKSQDECTDVARFHFRNYSVAHEPRSQHSPDNIINPDIISPCARVAQMVLSPEMLERMVWLSETRKNENLIQQQSRKSLTARSRLESINSEPYFDPNKCESRSSNSAQVTNSKVNCFNCPRSSNIEDYEQSEETESYEELPESSLNVSDTNRQAWSDQVSSSNNRPRKADYEIDAESRPQMLLLRPTRYYLVDERDRQLGETRQQHGRVSQNEQETVARGIQSHTMHETSSCAPGLYRLAYDPQKRDLHFLTSRTSDTEVDADTKRKLKLVQFIERNAETTDSDRQEEFEEEHRDGENVMRNERKSEELYDVEATVFRHSRKQNLARFLCFSIGCKSACCQEARCQPCYCDWKCDVKCFR